MQTYQAFISLFPLAVLELSRPIHFLEAFTEIVTGLASMINIMSCKTAFLGSSAFILRKRQIALGGCPSCWIKST